MQSITSRIVYSQDYLKQLPLTINTYFAQNGLDKEYGKDWEDALSRNYSEMWSVEHLILSHWRIVCRYAHTPGEALEKFLQGLREGKLLGTRCSGCGRVLIPPRLFCEWCVKEVSDWVEHSGEAVVSTYSLAYIGTDPWVRLSEPNIVAVLWLKDTIRQTSSSKTVLHAAGLMHLIRDCGPDDVRIGMRVKPVWKPAEQRSGSILDISHFKPLGD
ncbi:MAG: Zn-ribbon domain-containing OB-fold protein [Candidatus Caldarchaeum sp.]